MAKLTTQATAEKLVEQMLASFAATLDRELQGKIEARELVQATKTEDQIKSLSMRLAVLEYAKKKNDKEEAKKRKRKRKP